MTSAMVTRKSILCLFQSEFCVLKFIRTQIIESSDQNHQFNSRTKVNQCNSFEYRRKNRHSDNLSPTNETN